MGDEDYLGGTSDLYIFPACDLASKIVVLDYFSRRIIKSKHKSMLPKRNSFKWIDLKWFIINEYSSPERNVSIVSIMG